MSDPTRGQLTESRKRKSPPVVAEEKETPRAPKRIKLCLRAVVEALSKWRVEAKDLVFSDEGVPKKGGSAEVAKATAPIVKSVGPGDQSSVATHDVAVKKYRLSGDVNGRGQAAAFANELSLLSELHHDNIVQFIAFVESAEEDIAWILLRWEENGNIREFIHSQDWVIPERLELIYDVACGLQYLHSRDPPICHGDLKSLNVLVNSQSHAVITDFGSARKLEPYPKREKENKVEGTAPPGEPTLSQVQEQGMSLVQIEECGTFLTLTGPVYTLRWAAPEVLRDEEFTLASDMWAFAWVCWEIMTGSLPFNELRRETDIVLRIARGDLPPVTSNEHISQVRVLCVMLTRCWTMDPTARPAAEDCESSIRFMDRIAPSCRPRASELESYPAEVLCALGYTKYGNLQYKDAKQYFERALKVAESAGDATAAAGAMVGQGTVCRLLHEYAEAETLFTAAALESYAHLGGEITNAIRDLGGRSRDRNEYSKAKALHAEVREIGASRANEKNFADAIRGLGNVYRLRNEYSKAEASYTEAKEIYARLGAEKGVADAIWGLGEVYQWQKEYSKAEASYAEAKEIYARLGDEKNVADAIWGLGNVYRSRNEYSEAEASHTEAKEIYARLGAEKCVADAIWGLGNVYRSRNEYSKAEASYTEAKEIYARLGAEEDLADAVWGLGNVYRLRKEYSKAEASYTEAQEIYARLGAEENLADAVWGLGNVYQLRNEYSKAEASYTEAKEIYARLGAEEDVANAICRLGKVYWFRNEYSKAEASYTEAKEIYARLGVEKSVADAVYGLADVYIWRGDYSKAEASYTEAREIHACLGDEKKIADAIRGLGGVYCMRSEYSKAEALFSEAREIYARLGAEDGAARAIWELGVVYCRSNEYSKAEAFLNEARDIFSRLGDEKGVADATWGLGEVYRSREEYPKAEAALIAAREIFTKIGWQPGVEVALSSLAELSEAQGRSTGSDDSLGEASLEAEDEEYTRLRSSS